jgi:hypothetical protein
LIGALPYGVAFTYFAHTTLAPLASQAPNYEAHWQQLGAIYTLHGAALVVGGMLFTWAALRSRTLWSARMMRVRGIVSVVGA